MKRKLILGTIGLMTLATPMFAQTPAATGGGAMDLRLPAAYLAMGIASGLCGLGQGKATASATEALARNPGARAGIMTLLVLGLAFIESLTLFTLVIILIKV